MLSKNNFHSVNGNFFLNKMKPVLIYISMPFCHGCHAFKDEWNKLKNSLPENFTFVHFDLGPTMQGIECLTKRHYVFPIILLTDSKSYKKFFDSNNNLRSKHPDGYLNAIRYNVIEQDNLYFSLGRPCNANLVEEWVNKNLKNLEQN